MLRDGWTDERVEKSKALQEVLADLKNSMTAGCDGRLKSHVCSCGHQDVVLDVSTGSYASFMGPLPPTGNSGKKLP